MIFNSCFWKWNSHLGYSRKFVPSPIEDVSATYVKVWNSTYYLTKFSWKSRVRKHESLDFGCMCRSFLEIHVKIRIFVHKPWKSRTIIISPRKVWKSNLLHGGGKRFLFFFNFFFNGIALFTNKVTFSHHTRFRKNEFHV